MIRGGEEKRKRGRVREEIKSGKRRRTDKKKLRVSLLDRKEYYRGEEGKGNGEVTKSRRGKGKEEQRSSGRDVIR